MKFTWFKSNQKFFLRAQKQTLTRKSIFDYHELNEPFCFISMYKDRKPGLRRPLPQIPASDPSS